MSVDYTLKHSCATVKNRKTNSTSATVAEFRGPLFETGVVSEIVKHRTNRGDTGRLFFYRDRHGTEADPVMQSADGLTVVEMKASATPADGSGGRPARPEPIIL